MTNARFIKKSIKRKPLRENYEDFVIEDGVLVEYKGNDTDIVIPDEVREIGKGAFKDCDSLTSVNMSNVQTIGEKAFRFCVSLKSAVLPRVQTIGDDAFYYCSSITSVEMPNVQTIGDDAFYYCSSITSVEMPNVQRIGADAFSDCFSLTSVEMPNVTKIDDGAFKYCTSLKSISLLQVKTISRDAFMGCKSLKSVLLPKVQTVGKSAFHDCKSLTSISLPNVKTIGEDAFYGCTSLTSVSMPNVWEIDEFAFHGCKSLTDIDISPSAKIDKWAFTSTPIEQKVKEQFGLTECMSRKHRKPMREGIEGDFQVEGNYLVKYLGNEADVVIPDEIEIVGSGAFEHRKDIVSVKGKNIKSIDTYAFQDCYNLKSVDFPNVEDIEFSAFYDTGITAVDFPNATTIGRCAFQGCERLKVVNLPKVEEIGLFTFNEAGRYSGGMKINMPNLKVIGDYAFERAYLADPTDFPSVVTIREGAFNLAKMRTLNIPSVRKIGRNAFIDCIFNEINANPTVEVAKSAFGKRLSMVSVRGEPYVLVNDNGTYRAVLKSNSAEYGEKYSKSRRLLRKAKGIKEADGDMKTYEIIYTVDGTLSKQKVRAVSQSEAESLIKERNKGNVVIQTAKEIRGITEDVDKDVRPSPESGAATGIAGMLIDAINDEWETINRYNSMISTIRGMLEDIDNIEGITAGDLQDTVEIIEDINNEENNHVGMLQSALALYSENVETIKDGEKEADGIKTDVADGEIIKDEFADDEFVGRLVKNVKGVIVDA